MILQLELVGPPAEVNGVADRRQEFGPAGGTIGRQPGSTWVLPHVWVSRRHAIIRFVDGDYCIEDTSPNGVYVNSREARLGPGERQALRPGDTIFIDPYEIRVSLATAAEAPTPGSSSFDEGGARAPADRIRRDPRPASFEPFPVEYDASEAGAHSGELDPLRALGHGGGRQVAKDSRDTPPAVGQDLNGLLSEPVPLPPVRQNPVRTPLPGMVIPDDYDPLAVSPESAIHPWIRGDGAPDAVPESDGEATPPSAAEAPLRGQVRERRASSGPPHAARKPPASTPSGSLEALLEGVGLDASEVTPEVAGAIGEVLRVVVSGLMEALRVRQQIKSEFRLRATELQPRQNNPLKMSVNVEDALHNLFVKRNPGYLPPVEAFQDAFEDLRNHQVATLVGIRDAFETMLAKFDPDTLQGEFDRRLRTGALVSAPARLRYWEQYRQTVHDMVRDADTAFRTLFGDEFGRAYEEQMSRLRMERKR